MIEFEINKTFKNQAECDAWENENFPDRTYKGRVIMCAFHKESAFDDEVILTKVLCC